MKKSTIYLVISMILIAGSLSACQQQQKDPRQSVSKFVKTIEMASESGSLNKALTTATVVPVVYEGEQYRDPFEYPAMVKNAKQYPNSILPSVALDSLKLVGTVLHKDERWAIFRANDGKIYKMTEGMRVGVQQALLTQIEDKAVKFKIDINSDSGEKPRDVVISLVEPNQ